VLSSRLSGQALTPAPAIRPFKQLLRGALVLALVALAAVLSVAALSRLFGYHTLVVQGASMGQAIPIGSLVFTRWIAAEDVELGDVILVREERDDGPARSKLHRVVSLNKEGGQILVRTKGDANETVDPNLYILPHRVLTPAYTLPYLGYLVGSAATRLGWALLVALPVTVICIVTLRGIWAHRDKAAPKPGTA